MIHVQDIQPRTLMGPGPSDVHPRVLEAMGHTTVGHLDPQFLEVLNDIRQMLQDVFQTKNQLTLAVSGTGSAGMETCVINLIEPGDKMLVCIAGVFGTRMKDVAERAGAAVTAIEVPWGRSSPPSRFEQPSAPTGRSRWSASSRPKPPLAPPSLLSPSARPSTNRAPCCL